MDIRIVWRTPCIPRDMKAPVGLCCTAQDDNKDAYEQNLFKSIYVAMILGQSPMFTHRLTHIHTALWSFIVFDFRTRVSLRCSLWAVIRSCLSTLNCCSPFTATFKHKMLLYSMSPNVTDTVWENKATWLSLTSENDSFHSLSLSK